MTQPIAIDHVTIAGADLDRLRTEFAAAGLATDYGGAHSNGITHMALVGFEDGSYIELISTLERGVRPPVWSQHIAQDGGACGWAVDTGDVSHELARLKELGIPTRGPVPMNRRRPDGATAEWDVAFVDPGEPGATLPFLIHDRTARELRVRPSDAPGALGLTGIGLVVLGARDMRETVDRLRLIYQWQAPTRMDLPELGAQAALFPDAPVAVAIPSSKGTWLGKRLEQFGESPCAYLIRSTDFNHSASRLKLKRVSRWNGRQVGWLDIEGARLGIVG